MPRPYFGITSYAETDSKGGQRMIKRKIGVFIRDVPALWRLFTLGNAVFQQTLTL